MRSRDSLVAGAAVLLALGCNSSRGAASTSSTAAGTTTAPVTSAPASTPPPVTPAPAPTTPPPAPTPGVTIQLAFAWDYERKVILMDVGDRAVCKFTVGAQAPKAGIITCAEYNSPPQYRHGFLATDPAGANKVPKSETGGTSVGIFLGPGNAELQPNTTYYFIFDFELPGGQLSGPLGGPGESIAGIGNVSY